MNHMYFILSVAGWVWLAAVAVFIVIRLYALRRKATTRGFDVVQAPTRSVEESGGAARQ